MANVGSPQAVLEMREVQAAAGKLGIEVVPLEIRRAEDIAPVFASIKAQTDAIYLVQEALVNANRTRIITLVLCARLPPIFTSPLLFHPDILNSYIPHLP